MAYYLWNLPTANLVGAYPTRRAALRDVADAVERFGARSPAARDLALTRGMKVGVAAGDELIGLALADRDRPETARPARRRRAA